MTALKKYQRLESGGLWRDGIAAQRREVIVNLGDTSLVLSDPKSEGVLVHWSLPAVARLNPGALPARYAPGPDSTESLELDDADMIAALETVHAALEAARPHPGRLRNVIVAAVAVGLAGLGVFWLPGALVAHTASVLPPATRADVGRLALADITRLTGQTCSARRGQQALTRLGDRLFGTGKAPRLVVVREAVSNALHLPGRQILLSEALLTQRDGPEATSGFVLAESIRAEHADPMIPLLEYAGLRATFRLLTTGVLSPDVVAGYGETLLRRAATPLADESVLARFGAAGLSTSPYAYTLDPSGETVLGLIEADPFPASAPAPPLLTDEDWVSLQDICAN